MGLCSSMGRWATGLSLPLFLVLGLTLTCLSFCPAATASPVLGRDAMRAKMLRTYFQCPTCDVSLCPDVSQCARVVKEAGICGCCYTCALDEGEPCGMYTAKCAAGLKCKPMPGDSEPFQSLLKGTAMCIKDSGPSGKYQFGSQ